MDDGGRMGGWGERISLVDGPVFVLSYVLVAICVVLLVVPPRRLRVTRGRFLVWVSVATVTGLLFGIGLALLLDDVFDVFGVDLTPVVRGADALAFAIAGIALVNVLTARGGRIALAVVAVALAGWCLFLTINVDFGQYRTVSAMLGREHRSDIELPARVVDPVPVAEWTAPDDLPDTVLAGAVDIPASAADFTPRRARIVLPPAALADDPPALPVVVALSGQPGSPVDVLSSAGMAATIAQIAREHDGVAPIVVVPDQLGDPSRNTLCVDSPGLESATYLTVDVPEWIRESLNVSTDPRDWTIAGFSQGGTCSIQLGADHPDIFGSIVDISGEAVPSLGSPELTIAQGFGGSREAYLDATPAVLLGAHAPYEDSTAIFVVGERDERYEKYLNTVATAAEEAGMAVETVTIPGTAHDWNTAKAGFLAGFEALLPRWGIR